MYVCICSNSSVAATAALLCAGHMSGTESNANLINIITTTLQKSSIRTVMPKAAQGAEEDNAQNVSEMLAIGPTLTRY